MRETRTGPGALSTPGTAVFAGHRVFRGRRLPPLNDRSLSPRHRFPARDADITRHHREFPGSRPSGPSPRLWPPWLGAAALGLSRELRTRPIKNRPRASRWGQVEHRPVATPSTSVEPPRLTHSPHATSCRKDHDQRHPRLRAVETADQPARAAADRLHRQPAPARRPTPQPRPDPRRPSVHRRSPRRSSPTPAPASPDCASATPGSTPCCRPCSSTGCSRTGSPTVSCAP